MHAWVSLWCGKSHGWVGLDPTNAMMIGNDHIVWRKAATVRIYPQSPELSSAHASRMSMCGSMSCRECDTRISGELDGMDSP